MVVAAAERTIAQGIVGWKEAWRAALTQRDTEIIPALTQRITELAGCLREWQEWGGNVLKILQEEREENERLRGELREIREAQGNDSNPPAAPQIMEVPPGDISHPPQLPSRGARNGEEHSGSS